MNPPSLPLSLQLTHAPYWLVAAFMLVIARRVRRALEAIAAALAALPTRGDP